MIFLKRLMVFAIIALMLFTSIVNAANMNATNSQNQTGNFSAGLQEVLAGPQYSHAWWGLIVEDLNTGKVLYELNPENMFIPGSSAKLYTVAAALDTFGKDYRFTTPIYAHGNVNDSGVLNGDLILVASGDLTMGGRTTPDGRIAYTDMDHGDANALGNATLTEEDPLAGLNDLASQVAGSGIKSVTGDVIIDDRLFDVTPSPDPSAGYIITPIIINDNLILYSPSFSPIYNLHSISSHILYPCSLIR